MKKSPFLFLLLLFIGASCAKKPGQATAVKQYSIRQFYENSRILGGSFADDGNHLLFSSNKTGIFNAYQINLHDGLILPLTKSDTASLFSQGYVPGTQNFIFSADQGGNERTHLYLDREGVVKDLTPGRQEKADFAGWSRDGNDMYYLSNKRNPRFFDLYKMSKEDWKGEMLYQNDNGLDVGAISDNERYLLLTRSITQSETQLFLYDRQTQRTEKISKAGSHADYAALEFAHDNRSFYYLTNQGGEFMHVMQYDLESGEKEKVFSTDWDVLYMNLSYHGKYRVIGINKDARNVLKIIDNNTGKPLRFPGIENGNIEAVSIAKDESKMRLTVGSAISPNNLYVYDFKTKKLRQLTHTLNPEIDPEKLAGITTLRFKSFDGKEIPALFCKPKNASKTHQVPALVWVHGGPGGQSRVGFNPLIQYLVNHGYALLAVNNRGSNGYGQHFFKLDDRDHGNGDLKDIVYGKKYLASRPDIDSTRIGIIGGSYGGFMTLAALCFHPDVFDCGIDFFGVVNWPRTLKDIPPYWGSYQKALYAEMGNPYTRDSVMLKNISPLFHAGQITKPLLVLQGANDPRVQKSESDAIVQAVKKNGVPVRYVVFPDEGHGFRKKANKIKADSTIVTFLNKHL